MRHLPISRCWNAGVTVAVAVSIAVSPMGSLAAGVDQEIELLRKQYESLSREIAAVREAINLLAVSGPKPNPKDLVQPLAKTEKEATDALTKVGKDLDKLTAPESEIRKAAANAGIDTLKRCVPVWNKAATEAGAQALPPGCTEENVKQAVQDVRDTVSNWYGKCVQDLQAQGVEFEAAAKDLKDRNVLDADQRNKITQTLSQFQKLPDTVKTCIDGAKETAKDFDQSMLLISSMLQTAASMCMASGGNPYACAALFAIAVLAALFSKDGGGGGEGKGNGPDGPAPDKGKDKGPVKPTDVVVRGLGGKLRCASRPPDIVCSLDGKEKFRFSSTLQTSTSWIVAARQEEKVLKKAGGPGNFTSPLLGDVQVIESCESKDWSLKDADKAQPVTKMLAVGLPRAGGKSGDSYWLLMLANGQTAYAKTTSATCPY